MYYICTNNYLKSEHRSTNINQTGATKGSWGPKIPKARHHSVQPQTPRACRQALNRKTH